MNSPADLLARLERLERENAQLREHADVEQQSRLVAELELGKTKDRLQLALDAAGLAMWEWDSETTAIYTSLRFADLVNDYGYMQGNGQTWPPMQLERKLYGEDRLLVRQAILRTFNQTDRKLEVEFRVRTPAGVRWLEASGEVSKRDLMGKATRMVGIARDVTRRKLQQHEIETARALAVAANSAKDDFLAHISHEIRTPLNGVIGMNNLLAQTELAAEQRVYVDLVGSSGRALLALVNDVLDYSRLEAHKLILEQVRFPLQRWIWEVATPMRVSAEAKGLELEVVISDELPAEAVGDPGRLRQIVTNLISNAIKFTEKGRIEVAMRTASGFPNRLGLRIEVSDTGIGVPLEKQQDIFGAFVQADSSTSRRYGGTGLGLTICMKLAQTMGGRIDVDSAPGRGSRFVLSVPLGVPRADTARTLFGVEETADTSERALSAAGAMEESPQTSPSTSPKLEQPSQFPGKRALVVDDHGVNRLLATKLLEQLSFEVAAAENGEKAVHAIRASAFDLVLMDIQMPVMNGWQATHHIRKWEQSAGKTRIPIIALSAHASAADREQALASGMDGYLSKPLTPDALQAALRATRLAFKASRMESVVQESTAPVTLSPPIDRSAPETAKTTAKRGTASHDAPPTKLGLHNRQKMLGRLAGNEAALHEMSQAFCQDLRTCMGTAYGAVKRQDWVVCAQQGHALKGLLLSMTAESAAEHAKQMEQAAKNNDGAGTQAAFSRLSVSAREVFDVVRTW